MPSREQESVLGQRGREIQTAGPWGGGEGRLCTLGQFRLFPGSLSLTCKTKGAGPEASKGLPSSDNLWQIWVLLLMIDSGILWWSSG